jgi:5-methyltetrahydrofolate--homocysteine methyltransferase
MKIEGRNQDFVVVGENVHTTRVLLRKGKRIGETDDGRESILFSDAEGQEKFLPIPEKEKKSQDYEQGRVKHLKVAIQAAMATDDPDAATALEYIRYVAQRQIDTGADFLDLNVDEVSLRPAEQKEAMEWLVRIVEGFSSVPPSIDSSDQETLQAGLSAYQGGQGRPLLNSASLERIDSIDMALSHNAKLIITAAGAEGMPADDVERVQNASQMIDASGEKGLPAADLHVDLLVFPISVDPDFVNHFLDSVRVIRDKYGPDIHILGGLSNVSFGMPCRRLINDVFLNLCVEAGADGGIIDPVARDVPTVLQMDRGTPAYGLAEDMLRGRDPGCKKFLKAFRAGELAGA